MSMNANRNYTGAAGKFSDHWRSNCVPAICSSISRPEPKRRRSSAEGGLVLAVNSRCALVTRLEVGGGRSQVGKGERDIWTFWRPGWGQVGGAYVLTRRGWVDNAFPHMARGKDLSLTVLRGVGPSQVGLYQPSVLVRWLPFSRCDRPLTQHSVKTLFWIFHRRIFGPWNQSPYCIRSLSAVDWCGKYASSLPDVCEHCKGLNIDE